MTTAIGGHRPNTGITSEHVEVHEGEHFFASELDEDVDIAGPKKWRVTTPNTTNRIHFTFAVTCDAIGLLQFYEDPTLNLAGTGMTEFNNDRNSSNAATLTTFYDTTTQAPNNDGTLLWSVYVGAGRKEGGSMERKWEDILKQNEDYIIKFTPAADNTGVAILMEWYEMDKRWQDR